MRRRRTWSNRAKVKVITALLTGSSIVQAAEAHGVPVGTVKAWSVNRHAIVASMQHQKKAQLGNLLLSHLRTTLESLTTGPPHSQDPEWLSRQDARDLEALRSIQEEALRLLGALEELHQTERKACP